MIIDLGVVTRGPTAQQASAENARAAQRVLVTLKKALGPTATVETISYAVQPDYQYPKSGEPKITGYTSTNRVRVTQDDLSNVGTVIDTATRAGANQIDQIRFTLKDESAAKANALRGAAYDARTKASTLAGALGLQVLRIHSVDESGVTKRPIFDLELRGGAGGAAPTPIVPGSLETSATVTLAIEFASGR